VRHEVSNRDLSPYSRIGHTADATRLNPRCGYASVQAPQTK
jgi:hypothetical protein